jgi:Phycobilisome protein
MPSPIEIVFDEAENRYLKTEELRSLGQYVVSLPERVSIYRILRDQELTLMQQVADQLHIQQPDTHPDHLERSIKHGILILRYCAMGMLLADEGFVQSRLLNWLSDADPSHSGDRYCYVCADDPSTQQSPSAQADGPFEAILCPCPNRPLPNRTRESFDRRWHILVIHGCPSSPSSLQNTYDFCC